MLIQSGEWIQEVLGCLGPGPGGAAGEKERIQWCFLDGTLKFIAVMVLVGVCHPCIYVCVCPSVFFYLCFHLFVLFVCVYLCLFNVYLFFKMFFRSSHPPSIYLLI